MKSDVIAKCMSTRVWMRAQLNSIHCHCLHAAGPGCVSLCAFSQTALLSKRKHANSHVLGLLCAHANYVNRRLCRMQATSSPLGSSSSVGQSQLFRSGGSELSTPALWPNRRAPAPPARAPPPHHSPRHPARTRCHGRPARC